MVQKKPRKILKIWTPKITLNGLKRNSLVLESVMRPTDADGMTNSMTPDQTAPCGAV